MGRRITVWDMGYIQSSLVYTQCIGKRSQCLLKYLRLVDMRQHNILAQVRGDVKIPYSRMTKTCWETRVTCL